MQKDLSYRSQIFYLFVSVFILRATFFFGPFVGDFATYLIIGQIILDGDFALETFVDNKTYLLYFIYAVLLKLSFDNLYILQIYGSIIIFTSSVLILMISNRLVGKNFLLPSLIYIIFSSLFVSGGQWLMTEHIVILPVLLSFLCILKKHKTSKDFFKIGILISISALIRQNMIILALGIFIIIFLGEDRKKILGNTINYISGGLIPVLTILFFSLYVNSFENLLLNTFASIHKVHEKNLFDNFYELTLFGTYLHNFNFFNSENFKIFNAVSLYSFSFFCFIFYFKELVKNNKELLLYTICISISIFLTHLPNTHYLIQILPFLSFLIIIFYSKIKSKYLKIFFATNIFLLSIVLILHFYTFIFETKKSVHSSNEFIAAHWINKNIEKDEKIFLYRGHFIYWIIKKRPITKLIHPNTLFYENILKFIYKDKSYTTINEWEKIINSRPKYLVFYENDNLDAFFKKIYKNQFDKTLYLDNLKLVKIIAGYKIYELN